MSNKASLITFLEEGIERYDKAAELKESLNQSGLYFSGKASAYHDVLLLLNDMRAQDLQALKIYCAGLYGYAYQEGFNQEPKDFDAFWADNPCPLTLLHPPKKPNT